MNHIYATVEPSRAEVDAFPGLAMIEFGTPWCGHCKAAQPYLAQVLAEGPALHHLKIEDGSGLALGRSFQVKLWPTLVFLRDGKEAARLVRPTSAEPIREALAQLTRAAG